MKSGISLVEMAKEIQRQAELKADYVMDTRSLRLEPFGSDLYLNAYTPSGEMAVEPLEINAIAHRQIGTHLKIPAAYYDKMLTQHPQLLSENVNAWFEREPAVRLVRTIGGTARGDLDKLAAHICTGAVKLVPLQGSDDENRDIFTPHS